MSFVISDNRTLHDDQPASRDDLDFDRESIFLDGYTAGRRRFPFDCCPYNEGSDDYFDWVSGWTLGYAHPRIDKRRRPEYEIFDDILTDDDDEVY